MITSWPSRLAAGIKQALIDTHSVVSSPVVLGLATRIAQAPHSPSAQPSLAPVNPSPRIQSSAVVFGGIVPNGTVRPFTLASAAMVSAVMVIEVPSVRPDRAIGLIGR